MSNARVEKTRRPGQGKQCIYCTQGLGSAKSAEHHLPFGLGRFQNYAVLRDRICVACNGKCGKLDEHLLRSGPEAYWRNLLGISSQRRSHRTVNPVYRGGSGGSRLTVVGKSPEGASTLLDPNSGRHRELRHIVLIEETGKRHTIVIPDGYTHQQLRERCKTLGLKGTCSAEIACEPHEQQWIEGLFEGFGKFTSAWTQRDDVRVYRNVVVIGRVDERYFRAVAKIGFHYFLTRMTQFRGDEQHFVQVRKFIMGGGSVDVAELVQESPISLADEVLDVAHPASWGHIATAEVFDRILFSRIQLFAGPDNSPKTFVVKLGSQPTVIAQQFRECTWFQYYPTSERTAVAGECHEIALPKTDGLIEVL